MSRRKKGTGSIHQRKDGRWEGRAVIGYDEKGLPKTKNVLAKTKGECQEKLKQLRSEIEPPETKKNAPNMPFGEWMNFWFREYASPRLKESTRQTYRYRIYTHIIPKLGKIPLCELKTNEIQSFYTKLKTEGRAIRREEYGEGLSNAHVRSIHMHINAALNKAVTEGLILQNPATDCKLPPKKGQEMHILTKEEMVHLLLQAKEDGFFEMFFLDLSTGMRRGELLALKWEDIDFAKEEIRVTRQVNRVDGKLVVSEPKTKTSNRVIRLSKPILYVLAEYKKTAVTEWLFPSPVNPTVPREPAACRKALTHILEHAGCKHVRFHDLRHTFATMALENGVDIKTVAEILGHSTAETALNTYTHITEDMQRTAADRIDRKIARAEPKSEGRTSTATSQQKPPVKPFEPYKGRKRKPGTGYIKQLSQNCWQGRYTPTVDGKRVAKNVYGKTREECEEKLDNMIREIKK